MAGAVARSRRANDGGLRFAQLGDSCIVELEVGLDEIRRGESEPLVKTDVLEAIYGCVIR